MKLYFILSDFGAAANIGGAVETEARFINIPDEQLPPMVLRYLDSAKKAKETKSNNWQSLSFAFEDDREEAKE